MEGLLSPGHLLILLVIVLLVFGPKRLPELGRSLGGGLRGFKDAISGKDDEEPSEPVATSAPAPPAMPPPDAATRIPRQ
jgi:sec-independent protein translocase protein TatA